MCFSTPLDLDLAMLAEFPAAYDAVVPEVGGPKMDVEAAAAAVLGEGGPGIKFYAKDYVGYREFFPAYRYHFLTHSKPVTHLAALAGLEPRDMAERMPSELKALLTHIQTTLRGE